MTEHNEDASKRVAQRRLAHEILNIVHGAPETKAVEEQHGILFPRSKTSIKKEAREANPKPESSKKPAMHTPPRWADDQNPLLNPYAGPSSPTPAGQIILPRSLVVSQQVGRVLFAAGLVASRSEGHRLIAANGAYIGSVAGPQHRAMPDHVEFTPLKNWEEGYINRFIVNGSLLILRAGKWRVKVIKVVEDAEFEKLGLDVPGWKEFKEQKQSNFRVGYVER